MAYCVEFKKKVLEFWGRDKNTLRGTAEVFKISTNTLNRWKREFSQTGTFQKRPVQRKFRKINLEKLKTMLSEKPDMFQREMAEAFGVARRSIQNALKKLNFSRKKNQKFSRKR